MYLHKHAASRSSALLITFSSPLKTFFKNYSIQPMKKNLHSMPRNITPNSRKKTMKH
jgi:hypothetical protein